MKYTPDLEILPADKRADINKKILALIDSGNLGEITPEDIYNAYTGDGGLHGLSRQDYDSYYDYAEAKKEIENGQFFTPPAICELIARIIGAGDAELVCDPTCGKGDFFNYFKEQNCFGADIDYKATKVAHFLYPEATIIQYDILGYQLDSPVDYVVGNPPFNLAWTKKGERYRSQDYFFVKSAELMKLGGIIGCVVPESFMKDPFSDKSSIERVEENFSFIGQHQLSNDIFKAIGVENYGTKIMFFQRRSESVEFVPYSLEFNTIEELIEKVNMIQKVRKSMAVKLRSEMLEKYDSNFTYKVNKYLYEIRTHKALSDYLANSLAYVEKFHNQKCPEGEDYTEWEKTKITQKMVLGYLKLTVKKQIKKKPIDKTMVVKTKHGFKLKAYSPKENRKLNAPANSMATKYISMYKLVTGLADFSEFKYPVKLGYKKLVERKRKAYRMQIMSFENMTRSAEIDAGLKKYVFRNGLGRRSKFNEIQFTDLGLILQKNHAILNWQQGCVDSETEYLTPTGWKKISEYKEGDFVSQFNKDRETLEFVKPEAYIKLPCDKMLHYKHKYGLDQMLSEEHRVLFKNKSGKQWGVKTAGEIYEQSKGNINGVWGIRLPTTFTYSGGFGFDISDYDLRLQIAVSADGSFRGKNKVIVSLKKERKIERLKLLLENSGRQYTLTHSSGYTRFYFEPPIRSKDLTIFYSANSRQLELIAREVILWDGSDDGKYFTTLKYNADFIQYVFATFGRNTSLYTLKRPDRESTDYTVTYRKVDSGLLSIKKDTIKEVPSTDGFKYCFTVPTGFLILRRNNKIFITGNSGKTSAGFYWITYRKMKQNFIVSTPLSINETWKNFLTKHSVPFQIVTNLKDLKKVRPETFVLISFYHLKKYRKQLKGLIKKAGNRINLLFDESDEITNHSSGNTKIMLDLFRRAERTLLATGTTTRNNIAELYPQFELQFNNSYNFMNFCPTDFEERRNKEDGSIKIIEKPNNYVNQPFRARGGNASFKRCFNPSKTTVFGKQKQNQELFNGDHLLKIISGTIITRKFKEVAGDKYDVESVVVKQHIGERHVYRKIIDSFSEISSRFFESTGSAKKDAILQIIRQIQLLIKATSMPQLFPEYTGGASNKTLKIIELIEAHPDTKIAIGCTGLDAVEHYVSILKTHFPEREVFEITGGDAIKRRGGITGDFESTKDGILICTQQSLKSSINIPSCNLVIIESLQWNIPKIEQFYFRFIRYDSQDRTKVLFLNYENTIEVNLLALLMAKERLNDFVKTKEYKEESDVFEEFGIDMDILNQLMGREKDDEGKSKITMRDY